MLGEGEPKYLNSPETPIFHKGQLLYNLHVAKHAMRKAERAILVEGQFDVLRITLTGLEEVVAPLGTGLSDDQAALLQRHTSHVILLYDSDDAGLRAWAAWEAKFGIVKRPPDVAAMFDDRFVPR